MSGPAVRPARPEDAAAIAAIAAVRRFAAAWSKAALEAEPSRPDAICLVVADAEVRGYALARVVYDECRLLDLAAREDAKGWGRALLQALVAAASRRGCRRLTWEVSAANTRALSFYARAGAAVVGRRPKFYNDGSDAVLMDLTLP
ncbi:MAG: GNAT family N-acetyltransferase [Elusimicrobia bacterium]|nr:GNAT family N-acetyltransferase [Elusimicrobiota bacterium]